MRQPIPAERFNLSNREVEVLEPLAKGLNVQEIADALTIMVRTVNFPLGNTYKKLEVQSQSVAVENRNAHLLIHTVVQPIALEVYLHTMGSTEGKMHAASIMRILLLF
jgi:DNA-binding CsgD family transcriptional regulator